MQRQTRAVRLPRCLLLAALLGWPSASRADYEAMLRRAPANSNLLVLIDVKGLHSSPLGLKEGWAKRHAENFQGGVTGFPPWSERVVVASQFTPGAADSPWEIVQVELQKKPAPEAFAKAEGGSLDNVAGHTVVYSPRGVLFAQLDDRTVAAMLPPDRQQLGRWLRTRSDAPAISEYLQRAAGIAQEEAQVTMAIDLADLLVLDRVKTALEASKTLAGKKVNTEAMAKLLASLKGVTFGARVTDSIIGKLEIEFAGNPAILGTFGKGLAIEALEREGVLIDEIRSWKARTSESSLVLYGELSPKGLRQITSLVELPSSSLGGSPEGSASTNGASKSTSTKGASTHQSEGDRMPQASLRYYKTLTQMLDDLREMKGSSQGENALFHERYARKIDKMPILDVDPDLLAVGATVAEKLRDITVALRQVGIQTGAATAGMSSSVYYSGGGYGNLGYGYRGRNPAMAQVKGQEKAKGVTTRFAIWEEIDNSMAAIRRKMTDKYRLDF